MSYGLTCGVNARLHANVYGVPCKPNPLTHETIPWGVLRELGNGQSRNNIYPQDHTSQFQVLFSGEVKGEWSKAGKKR